MTQFRVSAALVRAGVPAAEQHIIYGECMKKKTAAEMDRIHELCDDVAGEWSDALYRFLTDAYINHVYVCMRFGIPRDTLFKLKRDFYVAWHKKRAGV